MDVRNCKKCNRLFDYNGDPLCPMCQKEMEDKFNDVRLFIRDNPGANMTVVSEELEVPIQQIKKWVRQERLLFSKDSGISIDCESCGKPILTGRFCNSCKNNMTNKFTSIYKEKPAENQKSEKVSSKGKMRFLGN